MTYNIAVCTVKTPDDGQRNCPKHVEFHSMNKLQKLVHLVGFIIGRNSVYYEDINLPLDYIYIYIANVYKTRKFYLYMNSKQDIKNCITQQ